MLLNPQPDGKTLALSNLKAFASDNFVVAEFFYDNAVFLLWEKEKKKCWLPGFFPIPVMLSIGFFPRGF